MSSPLSPFFFKVLDLTTLIAIIIFFAYNRAAASTDDPHDELKICCGQLISWEAGWENKLCNGNDEDYHVGGLVIELERCPHVSCRSCFTMNPLKNVAHQDTVHWSIILYSCGVCRGCYVMEGALNWHIMQGHGGPVGFEVDMNQKHGPEYMLKVPFNY